MQQLTCNIDLSCSFYYRFFSFVLIELKPFVLKGKVLGEKSENFWKSAKKCEKSETILPFSCCPLVFPWHFGGLRSRRSQNCFTNSTRHKDLGQMWRHVSRAGNPPKKPPTQIYPKDTAVLKTLRDSEFLRRSVLTAPPQIYYAVNPSLIGQMPAIPRKIVSAPGAPR